MIIRRLWLTTATSCGFRVQHNGKKQNCKRNTDRQAPMIDAINSMGRCHVAAMGPARDLITLKVAC